MTRAEYLETKRGQHNTWIRRKVKMLYFIIAQEPRSKESIKPAEKIFFRKEIRRQLLSMKRKAYAGDIILQIDFYTTQKNPPALHTLTKNYLDLLHKEIPEDKLKSILFRDDSQVKLLITNYHVDRLESNPQIRITVYRYSSFIKDVELADRILTNRFSDESGHTSYGFDEEEQWEERMADQTDHLEDLKLLEKRQSKGPGQFEQGIYELQKHFFTRKIQEKYLKRNKIRLQDLISIFREKFSNNSNYRFDQSFINIWNITRNYIFLSSDFLHLGKAPVREGEKKILKQKLQNQLHDFRKTHKPLFPLLQPVNVTVLFIPPSFNVPDLDNLARYIVPFINEILQPPITHPHFNTVASKNQALKEENELSSRIPVSSITGYQLIYIERKDDDPQEGRIDFMITDGFSLQSNVWQLVNREISKWEKTAD